MERTLASGGGSDVIILWDVSTGRLLHTLTGHNGFGNTGLSYNVAFSPDGNILASGSLDGTIHLWVVENGTHLSTITGSTSWIQRGIVQS